MQVIITTTSLQRYRVPDCATEEEAMQRVAATHGVKPNEIMLVEVSSEATD